VRNGCQGIVERVALTEGTNVPETVVDRGNRTTVLGMADLSQEHGGSHLGERVAETEDDTTSNVHIVTIRERSEKTTQNHEKAASNDRYLPAIMVRHIRTR
jgi:hypothetical protein